MGFSLKSERRSSRDLDRAVANMSLDSDKKEGIFASGAAWLSSKKSSSSLALDIQLSDSAERKVDSALASPKLPLSFDSLQSLTQELGSYMVHHEGFQAGTAPVRVAEVCAEQPSVTVATTTTIEPATATIVPATNTTPSFLPSLPASPPLDLTAEPAFATEQSPNLSEHKTATVPLPSTSLDKTPAQGEALLSSPSTTSLAHLSNSNNSSPNLCNDAATSTSSSGTANSNSLSSSTLSQFQPQTETQQHQHQEEAATSTQQDTSSHQKPSTSPQLPSPHSSYSSETQQYHLQELAFSPSLAQELSAAQTLADSCVSSSTSPSSPSSSPDRSLPSTGTLSPSTEPPSPTMLAQQYQHKPMPPLPPQAVPSQSGSQFVQYNIMPQGPSANEAAPAPQPQQHPYQPPPSTGIPHYLQQQQQQQQQPYHPPPPPSQQHPYQPPPTNLQSQQHPVIHFQSQPNVWPPAPSPSGGVQSLGIPSPTLEMQPRRSGSSTQMHQQYVQHPLPVVPTPTEDWGALLDRPDSPTQAQAPYVQFAAPRPSAFATNGMVASPAEEMTISRDYMQHQQQPSRSTPSPQPPNPYQSGQPLYGAQHPVPGTQRSLPPHMSHQHHASTSSMPMGTPLTGGGNAHGQQGDPSDNRQAFRKSWSYGAVMNGVPPQQLPPSDRQSIMSGGPGARTPGYNTPPRAGTGVHSKQASVATSVSLLTDAAIVAKYRETAIKTNDPSIQLSYAKYLLEIGSDAKLNPDAAQQQSSPSDGSPPTPSSSSSSTNSSDGATTPGRKGSSEDQEQAGKRQLLQEATYWIDRLAKEGQPEAQFIRGTWYEEGLYGTKRSPDKALRWFQSSSKGDYAPAHYKVGYYCEKRRDYNKAVMLYKKAAVQNDVPANHRLAMVYLYGELNQDQNMKTGLQYLNRAATNATESAPMAPYILGLILSREYQQLSIPDDIAFPDDGEALEWFKKSAELGYGPANYKLGYCHEIGALRCPIDPFQSIKYYERAVLAGDSNGDAEMALSGWYLSGADNFFAANESLAFQYAQRAADKGLAKAQYAMGYYYEVGISVPGDMNKAMEYYKLSAAQGNKDAQKRLSERESFNKLGHKKSVRRLKQNRKDKDKDCILM